MDEYTDNQLIEAFLNGDESAFETLYYRYRKMLYGFLHHLIPGNGAEIDEVFEETWLRVIDRLNRYRDDGKFSAWLFRISRNLYLDRLRRVKASHVAMSLDDENVPDHEGPASEEPDHVLDLQSVGGAVAGLLAELPAEQRETFLLRAEDFSFKEIAAIQNCSINTALARMRYAVANIRKLIEKSGMEELKK